MSGRVTSGVMSTVIAFVVIIIPHQAQAAQYSTTNAPNGAVAVITPAVEAFESTFSDRACLTEASITFEALSGRLGEYRGRGQIVINPNRPIATMPATVSHELGHHLMIACLIHLDEDFTKRFYAAQGIPSARGWFDYSAGWGATPAEQFAEAVSLYATGYRDGRIAIASATLELVEELEESPKRPNHRYTSPENPRIPGTQQADPSRSTVRPKARLWTTPWRHAA